MLTAGRFLPIIGISITIRRKNACSSIVLPMAAGSPEEVASRTDHPAAEFGLALVGIYQSQSVHLSRVASKIPSARFCSASLDD